MNTKRDNSMSRDSRTIVMGLCAVAVMVMTSGTSLAQEKTNILQFDAALLPAGNSGAGSRAISVAAGDLNGDGIADIVVGGNIHAEKDQNAATPCLFQALVTNEQVKEAKFEFVVLPDLGYGGSVNALTVPAGSGDDAVVVCAAGYVYDAVGNRSAAMFAKYDGVDGVVVQLPTPDDAGGEAFGIMAEWSRNNLNIVVCGKFVRSDGTEQACVWECTCQGNGIYDTEMLALDFQTGGHRAAAMHIGGAPGRPLVTGCSTDDSGRPQAVYWEKTEDGWQPPTVLRNLPGGETAFAFGAVADGTSNTTMFGGTAENKMGKMAPTIWSAAEDGSSSVKPLRLLPKFTQGRANGIIAILIGLLVPGEMSGPNGSIAALWAVNDHGDSMPINLNAIARGLPRGLILRSANAILPYMEQDGIYLIVGNATDKRGVSHGIVGSITMGAE